MAQGEKGRKVHKLIELCRYPFQLSNLIFNYSQVKQALLKYCILDIFCLYSKNVTDSSLFFSFVQLVGKVSALTILILAEIMTVF